jgi:hypothetical protein
MKHIIYLLLLVILFAGCKTTKQKTETQTDVSERKNIELHEEKASNSQLLESIQTNENLNIASNIIENMLFTLWSVPDSLGNQYPVATGEINRQSNTNQTKETNTNSNTNLSNENKQTADLKDMGELDSKSKEKATKEETKKVPSWVTWAGLVLIIGGILTWALKR